MPSPVLPSQFCAAVPSTSADMCTRLKRMFDAVVLLCDFFTWFLNNDGSISNNVVTELSTTLRPPGELAFSAGATMGSGWLLCDGSQVSRTTYAALFAVVGTRYGVGDGSTTFQLPDFRSRSPMGAGQGSGLTNRPIDTNYVGEEDHTMTEQELVPHHHTWSGPLARTAGRGDDANVCWRQSADDITQDTGEGVPFNVVHPCFICYVFIKT